MSDFIRLSQVWKTDTTSEIMQIISGACIQKQYHYCDHKLWLTAQFKFYQRLTRFSSMNSTEGLMSRQVSPKPLRHKRLIFESATQHVSKGAQFFVLENYTQRKCNENTTSQSCCNAAI